VAAVFRWLAWVPLLVLLVVGLEFYFATRLLVRWSRARSLRKDEEPELWRTVENLCIGAGLPPPRLYVVEVRAPNAFAAGLDPKHSVLVVTRGLLQRLDHVELEGVLAHELSHIGNYDTRLKTVVAVLLSTLRLPLDILRSPFRFLRAQRSLAGTIVLFPFLAPALVIGSFVLVILPLFYGLAHTGLFGWIEGTLKTVPSPPTWDNLPIILLLLLAEFAIFLPFWFPFYLFLLAPYLGGRVIRALSIEREFLADADAVLLTRNPGGLARALAKIAATDSSIRMEVNPAIAHLYVVAPTPLRRSWWDKNLSTHPPIEQRLARLVELGAILEPSTLPPAAAYAELLRDAMAGVDLEETPEAKPGFSVAESGLYLLAFLLVFLVTFWFLTGR
jgi:heat shock protein HtpX